MTFVNIAKDFCLLSILALLFSSCNPQQSNQQTDSESSSLNNSAQDFPEGSYVRFLCDNSNSKKPGYCLTQYDVGKVINIEVHTKNKSVNDCIPTPRYFKTGNQQKISEECKVTFTMKRERFISSSGIRPFEYWHPVGSLIPCGQKKINDPNSDNKQWLGGDRGPEFLNYLCPGFRSFKEFRLYCQARANFTYKNQTGWIMQLTIATINQFDGGAQNAPKLQVQLTGERESELFTKDFCRFKECELTKQGNIYLGKTLQNTPLRAQFIGENIIFEYNPSNSANPLPIQKYPQDIKVECRKGKDDEPQNHLPQPA